MQKTAIKSSDLVCLECGNVFTIMRKNCKLREVSHLKKLWCYKCQKFVNHYEVCDIDSFMHTYTHDEVKLYVKDLVLYGKRDNLQEKRDRVLKKILEK